jgi:type VI secretion system protein ImpK
MMPEDDRPQSNRTVFRPSPLAAATGGGVPPVADPRPTYAYPPAVASALGDDVPPLATPASPRNPVMAVAARLLTLAAALQAERRVSDPAGLLRTATGEAKAFEKALAQLGLSAEDNARARYAVLATLDDIVQNLPGGSTSDWARQSLVVQSFGQAFGGDQFWTILDNMLARPAAYRDLLEVYHACLAVGFQGRYRVVPDAQAQLAAKMAAIVGAMGDTHARPETDLVPHWRGVPTPVRRVGWLARLALAEAAVLAALLVIFFAMKLWLDGHDGAPAAALRRIPALAPARIDRAGGDLPAHESGQLVRIRERLRSPCIRAEDDGATVRLVISACPGLPPGMFEAGAAELADAYRALVIQAGEALKPEPGGITVAAHTDSDAIRGTLAASYPDNAALSQARARDAAAILAPVTGADRLTAVGRGDREPVDRDGSAAGKARNRRVELIIPRTGP